MTGASTCGLCEDDGGDVLYRDALCRVVLTSDRDYPGFCRVIVSRHVKEMTDLAPVDRAGVMRVVFAAEEAVRAVFAPDKMNVASLGNVTPHVHWHVIPRRRDDARFPDPVWGPPRRRAASRDVSAAERARLLAALEEALRR